MRLAREQGTCWIWKNDLSETDASNPRPCAARISTLRFGVAYVVYQYLLLLNVQYV